MKDRIFRKREGRNWDYKVECWLVRVPGFILVIYIVIPDSRLYNQIKLLSPLGPDSDKVAEFARGFKQEYKRWFR